MVFNLFFCFSNYYGSYFSNFWRVQPSERNNNPVIWCGLDLFQIFLLQTRPRGSRYSIVSMEIQLVQCIIVGISNSFSSNPFN